MNIKEKIIHLVESGAYTQKGIARESGLSEGQLSQYLKGAYKGNLGNTESALQDFLYLHEDRLSRRNIPTDFIRTSLSSGLLGLIKNTHADGDIGVIYGPAGTGKTMALQHYADNHVGVVLIEADPGYTAKVLLVALCDALKIEGKDRGRNISDMTTACIKHLKGRRWIVLVDEAELLPYRALEVLRRIHDRSGVALVLAGLPRLVANLKGSKNEFAQLYSRVGMATEIVVNPVKTSNEDEKDFEARLSACRNDFFALLSPLLPKGVMNKPGVAETFWRETKGNYRRMFKLARGVIRMVEFSGGEIDEIAIKKYSQMLIH